MNDTMRSAVQEQLKPLVLTEHQQRLFELRALLHAKMCSLVWRLVDMRGSGAAENAECQALMSRGMIISQETPDIHKRLEELRSGGKNWSKEFVALKRVLEHWKRCWHNVQVRLEAEGVV